MRAGEALSKANPGSATRSLYVFVVASVVLPALVFIAASWLAYDGHFRQARERLARTLDVVHEHAVKVFETHDLAAEQINEILGGLDDEAIRSRESALNPRLKALDVRLPQINDIWVLNRDGRPLVTANFYPAPVNLDLSDRAYYRVHRDSIVLPGRPYVSEVLRGRADPTTTFFQVSLRRRGADGAADASNSDAFAGVTAISVEPRYFRDFYAGVRGGDLDVITLPRNDGAILARHPDVSDIGVRAPAGGSFMSAIARSPERGFYETNSVVDGVGRLYAYRQLPGYPVYVLTGIEDATILREWRATMGSHLLFGVPATAGLFTLALLALRRAQRESRALAQLQAEIARRGEIEDQLRQSQKMEAVGRLTGGIAHDFNNLLQVVVGSLDMLLRRIGESGDERQRRLATNALEGANRAASLTSRLLAFSRQQPLDPAPLDANKVVSGMSDMLRRTLGEAVRIETVLAGGLWQTFADRNGLENAILNLAVNARDAMPDGGKLTIETANGHLDEAYAAAHDEVTSGQYVLVSLTDTGAGMAVDVAAKAFEPFFTTKPTGQGTGLGLSMVFGFIKQSGGHVKLYSEVNQGTTVKLYLPRYFGQAVPDAEADGAPATLKAREAETILVVEDEPSVREFSAEALRELGYNVLQADGAAAALRLIATRPDIALLLTDVVMPDVNGRKLADDALKRRPDLPVLFMTGYTRNAIVHNGVLDPGVHLISKPYTVAQLGAKLHELLGQSASRQSRSEL
jgi:signal transduction histidine kinase/ActR/RegA family two-component response regulator